MNNPTFPLRHAWAVLLLVLPMMAGCSLPPTPAQRAAAIQGEANQAAAACRKSFGVGRAQITEREQCINGVAERFYPSSPLTPLANALRLEEAEKVRSGKTTYAEANADLVRKMFDARQRQSQTRTANAAAVASIVSSMPQ